jgi:DNA-binding NarL/FixJ family response regulator
MCLQSIKNGLSAHRLNAYDLSFMGNIQVLIVDDYPEMRQLLREVLHSHPRITVIGEARTGEDAVTEAARLRPTLVIIDFQLPTMSGIEATRLIKLRSPSTVIIGLTAGVPGDAEKTMLDVGAAAILDKGEILNTLHPTIMKAVKV